MTLTYGLVCRELKLYSQDLKYIKQNFKYATWRFYLKKLVHNFKQSKEMKAYLLCFAIDVQYKLYSQNVFNDLKNI